MLPNLAVDVIAAGTCPSNAPSGYKTRGANCELEKGLTGSWFVTTDDENVSPGKAILIPSAADGSNPNQGGLSFGQGQQIGRRFAFTAYYPGGEGGAIVPFDSGALTFVIFKIG